MFCTFRHCLELMTQSSKGHISKMKRLQIPCTPHCFTLFRLARLTFGFELWNIYEKFLGHTNKSFFNTSFCILDFYRGLPKSLPMQDFTYFYHYKSTWQNIAKA